LSAEAKRGLAILALVVAVAALVAVLNGSKDDGAERGQVERMTKALEASVPVEVVYELEGSVPYASVTMITPTGMQQLEPDIPLVTTAGATGLRFTFDRGEFVSIAAQKVAGSGRGTITCRISVDGQVISENTSTAAYGIASCDGSADKDDVGP
jgi:hypothetical protein